MKDEYSVIPTKFLAVSDRYVNKLQDMEHIVEPYRLSLLDVLKGNLKAANRVLF